MAALRTCGLLLVTQKLLLLLALTFGAHSLVPRLSPFSLISAFVASRSSPGVPFRATVRRDGNQGELGAPLPNPPHLDRQDDEGNDKVDTSNARAGNH